MVLDVIAALIIAYAFYRGFKKGLIDTVVDVMSILIALVCAIYFSPFLVDFLQDKINLDGGIGMIVAILIIFFAVMLTLRFIADKMEAVLKATNINFVNQIAGGVLLSFVVCSLVGMVYGYLTSIRIIDPEYAESSTLYGYISEVTKEGSWVMDKFKSMFSDFWQKFMEEVKSAKDSMESKPL